MLFTYYEISNRYLFLQEVYNKGIKSSDKIIEDQEVADNKAEEIIKIPPAKQQNADKEVIFGMWRKH